MADVKLQDRLKAVVARITGHRPQDLDREMFLEGDLGLDSIKTVELINAVIELVPEEKREQFNLEVSFQRLAQIQTLGELVDVMDQWQAATQPATPAAAVAAPAAIADPVPAASNEQDLEILHAQYPFLVSHWAICSCSLSSRVRLRGPFDPAVAREAWNDLIARHPILKARFAGATGATSLKQYRIVCTQDVTAPVMPVTDLRNMRSENQDAFVADEMHRALDKVWDLERWPLHSITAFQLAADEHDLVFANHHLISDGLGNQIMVRDFLELYRARATKQRANLPEPLSFEAYAQLIHTLNSWHDEQDEKRLADFVKRQGKERFFWNPAEKTLTATRAQTRVRRHRLSVDATTALKARAADIRIPLNSILVGAYLKALSRIGSAPDTYILNIPTSGRVYPEADASDALGCFAQNLALTFKAPQPDESWQSLFMRVHEEIESAILGGYDRAQARQTAIAAVKTLTLKDGKVVEPMASMVRAGVKSNLYLPFTGQTRLEKSYGPLTLIDYEAATATNPGTLDNLVEIFHGSLQITANYDSGFFAAPFVDSVIGAFLGELETVARTETRPQPAVAATVPAQDPGITALLQEVLEEVCHQRIGAADLDKHLERDLGLDSLERIRIVTRLHAIYAGADRHKLLACQTVREMANTIAPEVTIAVTPRAVPAASRQGAPDGIPYMYFVDQARKRPKEDAIVFGDTILSYGELHAVSNRLANHLRAAGVDRGHLVGIMTRPGPNMLTGMLAIQKAGGAYVPLDPDYPAARLAYITEHSGLQFLLTESDLAGEMVPQLDPAGRLGTVLLLDEEEHAQPLKLAPRSVVGRAAWMASKDSDPAYVNGPDDLMAVLYTSGSTGRPKGAMLAHRGYMNRLQWMQDAFQLAPGDRVAQKTSCCFDISVWELFWPLMFGAIVCPVERETVRNPWKLARWIEDTRINVMHFVPSLFVEFLSAIEGDVLRAPHLRQLVFSGEALPVPVIQRWIDRFGMRVGLANLYGPTEASIDVTAHFIQRRPGEDDRRIPIGKAIDNVQLMVLDEQMKPCPQGEIGELWIGGIQLAKGYLNNQEATAAAFHPNPFPHVPGESIYRTGDLCSQLPDGSFDYHGRRDSQVKIRGFRVELGEIEGALNSHPAVDESAVLAVDYGDGQKRLVAWLAGRSAGLDFSAIKEYLQQRLPEYMIPHRVEWAVRLPKNVNGKQDRKALRELLNADPDAGEAAKAGEGAPIEPAAATAEAAPAAVECALGPAQRWLVSYFDPPYQWAGYTRFRYHQPLDLGVFDRALGVLVARHPALRTIFHQRDARWYQQVLSDHPPFASEFRDGSHLDEQTREARIRDLLAKALADLSLDRWPLWRVLVVKVDDACYEIAVAGHHLISDLLSNSLLFDEMWRAYGHLLAGNDDGLGAAPPSFTSFVQLLEQETGGGTTEAHLEYWRSRFPSREYKFDVPLDHRLGANVEASSASERFRLPEATNGALLHDMKSRYGSSFYGLLLAPLYRALAEWTGESWVVLSHRTHGRDLGDGRTFFETVGNFAVNFPVGVTMRREAGWQGAVDDIAKAWREVPMRGVTYDLLGDRLPAYLYPDTNLTPVRVNYLGNRTAPRSGLFEFDEADRDRRHSAPDQVRTTLIEVFFSVADGALEMEINYSRNFHAAATIRRLGEQYLSLMEELIAQAPPPVVNKTIESQSPALMRTRRDNAQRPLAGKVAIVTGGGRGLGRTTALALAEQGAAVAVVSRTASQIAGTLDEIQSSGARALAITADVGDLGQVEAMMREVVGQLGGLDILVNNAGITGMSSVLDSDPAEWRGIVETNLFGAYYCCRTAVPHLLARGGGKIINIGSDSSLIGYPLFSAYAASKHGLLGLTRSLAEELKQRNVQVNAVCPSFVDTDMTPRSLRERALPREKVAEVVLFLASAASDGITGEALRVFGTQDMYWYGSQRMNLLQKSLSSGVHALVKGGHVA